MTSLTLKRRIVARPEIVFDAFLKPEAIAQWWGPDGGPVLSAETGIRVGGAFKVRFQTLDGLEHECSGVYLEMVRPTRLAMSWRWTDGGELAEKDAESRVEVTLRRIDIGTELTFTHARLQNETSRASHEAGWNGALDKLERLFEGETV